MTATGPRTGGAALLVAAGLLGGCVYYNTLYNAERLYDQGESHRRAGEDSLAAIAYRDVVRKAAEGYRRDPEGEWADDALLLMGRARLRLGELRAGQAALREAAARAEDEPTRLSALVYLGSGLAEAGHKDEATLLLNEALQGLDRPQALAEGHLQRGRLLLAGGNPSSGWWDLDRALDLDPDRRLEAALESLRWAIQLDDRVRVADAMHRLLGYPEAAARFDTIVALVRSASGRWGPGPAAELLAGADSARWGGAGRGRIRLERARLLHEAGGADEALEAARAVASGFGSVAGQARLQLARWTLTDARNLAEVEEVMELLGPSAEDEQVGALLDALEELSRLTSIGLDDPLGLFAAAEVARTRLDAPVLARGLYLAYADGAPDDPWAPKALLAALVVSGAEGDREWIRGRLEARGQSPYARAARGEPAPGLAELEEELARRMAEMGRAGAG